jgi:Na+-translocating ferredoxin:NAD+ oxidoreductase subunit D
MKNLFLAQKTERFHTVSLRPFKYLGPSVGAQSLSVLAVLFPQVLLLAAGKSYSSLFILAAALLASFAAEAIDAALHQREYPFSIITAAVQGVVIGMLLPSGYPPIAVFFVSFGTLLIGKYAYGGLSNSWINPAAITVITAWLIGMTQFPAFQVTFEQLQIRNPSLALIQNGTFPTQPFDAHITSFLNTYLFRAFGVSIPEGYVSLFWDTHSVIPAFRFNLLTVLSSVFLIATNCVSAIIPGCYLLVYGLLVSFAGPLFYHGIPGQGDVLLAFLSSGTLFSVFFVLQWYGTTPVTRWGKAVYGIAAGIAAFIVVGCGTSPVGTMFTVLIVNILSPVIQLIEDRRSDRYLEKVLIPQVAAVSEEKDD